MNYSFLAENRLEKLSPDLHKRYTGCVAATDELLGKYLNTFPQFTDHSMLHSMEVANYANLLISNRIDELCAEELYILLMAALLHDIGMGYGINELSEHFPSEFKKNQNTHSNDDIYEFVRKNHHDLSAMFVLENWKLCLIPDEIIAAAVAEVGRGHRKTDLLDKSIYPTDLKLGDGIVNMAYLAAVIRLADELDISSSRNLQLMFTGFVPTTNIDATAFQIHRLLKIDFIDNVLILKAQTANNYEYDELISVYNKVRQTFDYCNQVVISRAKTHLPVRDVQNEIVFINNDIPLILNEDHTGNTLIVSLTGKLDSSTYTLLDECISNGVGGTVINLILDCTALTYVSSAGLRIFLGAKKKTMALNGEMKVVNITDEVMSVLRVTGFDTMLGL